MLEFAELNTAGSSADKMASRSGACQGVPHFNVVEGRYLLRCRRGGAVDHRIHRL
jgi:hypothetical protein